MSHKYEVERLELKAKISTLRTSIGTLESSQKNRNEFISSIRKFMSMETLTAPLLRELIDRIEVYEIEGSGKNKTQRVAIYYKFVGCIAIPEEEVDRIKSNTRKGVEISCISEALPTTA